MRLICEPDVFIRKSVVVSQCDQVSITKRFVKGHLVKASGVASKRKKTNEDTNNERNECTQCSKRPKHGVAKNLLLEVTRMMTRIEES